MESALKPKHQKLGRRERERPSSAATLWQHASVHTPAALRARKRLRHDRRVMDELDLWWSTAMKSMQASGREDVTAMNEEEYVKISTKIYRTMIQPFDETDATANAQREWRDDTKGSDELPCESFKDAIFELADLWTAGIDALEYSLFLRQLFSNITEGQPPDKYFWMPTESIVHGGYTSPRKVRLDEPTSESIEEAVSDGGCRSPCMSASKLVEVLTLDDEGHEIESRTHEVDDENEDDDVHLSMDMLRSPLRGGRRGVFAKEGLDVFTASFLASKRRPQSSPSLHGRTRMCTAPAPPHAEAVQSNISPRTQALWHDSTWHRPITASKEARPVGVRPNVAMRPATGTGTGTDACLGRVDAVDFIAAPPPTAGMSALGLVGGLATERSQREGNEARIGLAKRPSTSAPVPSVSWTDMASVNFDAYPISAAAPVRMHSSLPAPQSARLRRARHAVKAASKLLELDVSKAPDAGDCRHGFDRSNHQPPLMRPTPPSEPPSTHSHAVLSAGRRPLGALHSNHAVQTMVKRHALARRRGSHPVALLGAGAHAKAGSNKAILGGHLSRAPLQRRSRWPLYELPLIGDGQDTVCRS